MYIERGDANRTMLSFLRSLDVLFSQGAIGHLARLISIVCRGVMTGSEVLADGKIVTEQLCHLFQRLALRLGVEEKEADRCHDIARYEDRIVAPLNGGKGFGGKLVEQKADTGAEERTDYPDVSW